MQFFHVFSMFFVFWIDHAFPEKNTSPMTLLPWHPQINDGFFVNIAVTLLFRMALWWLVALCHQVPQAMLGGREAYDLYHLFFPLEIQIFYPETMTNGWWEFIGGRFDTAKSCFEKGWLGAWLKADKGKETHALSIFTVTMGWIMTKLASFRDKSASLCSTLWIFHLYPHQFEWIPVQSFVRDGPP